MREGHMGQAGSLGGTASPSNRTSSKGREDGRTVKVLRREDGQLAQEFDPLRVLVVERSVG